MEDSFCKRGVPLWNTLPRSLLKKIFTGDYQSEIKTVFLPLNYKMKYKDQNTQKNVGVTIVLLNEVTAFYCIKLLYSYYNFTLPFLNEPIACSFNIEEIQCFL